jgi:hypothetical protein
VTQTLDIFDCNARIGTRAAPPPCHISAVPDLLAEMDRIGIRQALVCHTWAEEWHPIDGNARLLRDLAGQDRLFPCFVGLPEATGEIDPRELAAMARAMHGAVRIFPLAHEFRLTPWNMGSLLEALQEQGVPLLVTLTQTDYRDIQPTLEAFPGLPLVLLTTYYRQDRYLYALWERHDNLYVDLSGYLGFRAVEAVTRRFGVERIVFGSDLPMTDAGSALAMLTYAEISDDEKALLAGGTMRRLLGLGGVS